MPSNCVTPDRDIASAILVAEDGRYLLQLRDDRPDIALPAHWALFGGGIEQGEDAAAALRRELREEIGLTVTAADYVTEMTLDLPHIGRVWRLHFFSVPIRAAAVPDLVQTEGAGRELFTTDTLCRLERVSPWDLAAILIHARAAALWPYPLPR